VSAIRLEKVSKSFQNREAAVGQLSMVVREEEVVVLLGPSGSGKTTLLRLIAGFERPETGMIVIGETVVSSPEAFIPPEQRGVGMVFQDYALFPHLTVEENVGFGIPQKNGRRAERIRWFLDMIGLAPLRRRFPHELSGGEQQRVALARSLATQPRVLLLDEPFSNLDADLRPRLRVELKRILRRLGCTTIFVTHDQEEAFELGDRVAVMNRGRVEQIDTPERLYHKPATLFVADFVGQADFLPGQATEDLIQTEVGIFSKPAHIAPDSRVQVMFRPEDVELLPLAFNTGCVGVIVSRQFRGAHYLFSVRLDSGRELHSYEPPVAGFAPGQKVAVRVTIGSPTVFPAGEP
jgi:iron(III) transport system ATP-binding protein